MSHPASEAIVEALKDLWLAEGDLSFLHGVELSVLERIHAEVSAHSARVHEGQRSLYETMAKATRFIPNFMMAKLGGGLSAYVQARICEYLEVKTAAGLTKHYDHHTLGEISLHLEASRAAAIAAASELEVVVQITESLAKKGFYKRLGEISDALDDKVLAKMVERLKDPERIAHIAAHMQQTEKLRSLSRRIDRKLNDRVRQVLESQGYESVAALIA